MLTKAFLPGGVMLVEQDAGTSKGGASWKRQRTPARQKAFVHCGAFKTKMRNIILIILLFASSPIFGQTDSKKENYKPVNLEEAVEQLKIIHHDTTKQKIIEMREDEFMVGAHMGLGMWMRNNWGLWKGKELAKYFNTIGIYHPDDMSGIILTSYYRELHDQEWKVDEQVK